MMREHWCHLIAIHLKLWPQQKPIKANTFCTGRDPEELPAMGRCMWADYFHTWDRKPPVDQALPGNRHMITDRTALPIEGDKSTSSATYGHRRSDHTALPIEGDKSTSSEDYEELDYEEFDNETTPLSPMTTVALSILDMHFFTHLNDQCCIQFSCLTRYIGFQGHIQPPRSNLHIFLTN